MESVHRNIILDLLPAYIAGEASEETRALIEEFARNDVQIARLIRAGALEPSATAQKVSLPEGLEVKAMKRIRRSIQRQMLYVALGTASLLMVPLVAMQFSNEVKWTAFDFIVAGALLFGTGLAYILVSRMMDSAAYKFAVGIVVAAGLLLVWINLAVGIIGSEDNPANALYFAVLLVGLIGAGLARLRPNGMARAAFVTALAQALVPVTALIIWRPTLLEPPGVIGVFILNSVFVGMFVVAGLLFRRAGETGKK